MKRIWSNKYVLIVNAISIMVAFLTHFPELITLSNPYSADGLSFPGMHWADVGNEVLFTYLSLLFLFFLNEAVFRFNSDMVSIGWKKVVCSFVLTWVVSNLLGKCFVYLHQHFDVPAIDAMLHHYLHPLRDFLITCIVTGSCYFFHQNRKSRKMLLENQQLRMENVINQYEALKSQLNPHMLFNSLNTLYLLIRESPDKARHYLEELSRVMRYTLQDNESHSVTLREEMEFVQSYMYLLQVRYEDNLQFDIRIHPELMSRKLPPMALQLLVENAVKHNEISNRRPLTVSVIAEGDTVEVSNPLQPKRGGSAGMGIGHNRKRGKSSFHRYFAFDMKTLIIEDEKAALRNLKAVMQEVDTDFEIVGEVDSIFDGVEWFRTHPMPELVFMDIHLADGSAFDICAQVDITCPIIFTTAYDEYALRAFKVNSVAYLLKPISRTDLQEAMHKLELLGGQVKEEKQPDLSAIIRSLKKEENYKTHFLVPVKGDKLLPVSVEAIQYFYISNGLVKAVDSEGKEFVFSQSLDELAEQLNPHDFFRANRQFIVSRKAVSDISLWFNGRLAINLKVPVPEKIIISKAKASELKDWF